MHAFNHCSVLLPFKLCLEVSFQVEKEELRLFWARKTKYKKHKMYKIGLPWWLSGKDPPANVGDMGSILVQKIPHAKWEKLSPWATTMNLCSRTWDCNYRSPHTLEPMLCNKRSHCNEKPMHCNQRKTCCKDPAQPKIKELLKKCTKLVTCQNFMNCVLFTKISQRDHSK